MLVPVEQAAVNALAAVLAPALADVEVRPDWPGPSEQLFDPKLKHGAVTLSRVGERQDELMQVRITDQFDVHAAVSPRITDADATDLPTAIALVEALVAAYEAHRVSTDAHLAADTADAVTAPAATNLPTALARANDLRARYEAHRILLTAHERGDAANAIAAPVASDLSTLIALANATKRALARHYVSRWYAWLLAGCRLAVQLDIWAVYPGWRDDIQARLEPLLNRDYVSARPDPVRNGALVPLGDGFRGTADILFSKARVTETSDATQRAEHRVRYPGTAEFNLTVISQSPRMTRLEAALRLANQLPVPAGTPTSTGVASQNAPDAFAVDPEP